MPNTDLLSPWVRRFLLEYLVAERNLARNTQKSYRDALQQFLPFSLAPPTDGSSGFEWRTFRQPAPELSFRIWKKLAAAGSPREISVLRRSIPWRDSLVCTARNTWNGPVRFRPSRRRRLHAR